MGVPPIRSFRLGGRNFDVARRLAAESLAAPPDHLDLRIGADSWARGEMLVGQLERILPLVQTSVISVTGEELLVRYKNEQLRRGLL